MSDWVYGSDSVQPSNQVTTANYQSVHQDVAVFSTDNLSLSTVLCSGCLCQNIVLCIHHCTVGGGQLCKCLPVGNKQPPASEKTMSTYRTIIGIV